MTNRTSLLARCIQWVILCITCLGSTFSLAAPGSFGGSFLPPTEAFRPSIEAIDSHQVRVRFDIQHGYYL